MKKFLPALLIVFALGAPGFAGSARADDRGEIITAEQIRAMKVTRIADLLNRLPGINATDGSVSIRGSVKVKVFLDGRPINDRVSSHGGVHFDLVSLENVAAIEIIRGKGALQYGDDASAGVILITTRKEMGHGGNIKGWLGSGATRRLRTNIHLQQGGWAAGMTLGYTSTAGFVTNDDLKKRQAGLRGEYGFAKGRLGLTLDFTEEEYGLPGRVEFPSPSYRRKKKMYAISVPASFRGLTANTFYNDSRRENRDPDRGIDTFMKVREAGQDISGSRENRLGAWRYGGNFRWGEARSSGFGTEEESSLSLFGQYRYTLSRIPLTSTIGLRLNSYSGFAATVNPELKLGRQEEDWALAISYSRANNAPTFYQRYDQTPTKDPNPGLGMETSDNFDLDWSLSCWPPLNLSGSFFYNLLTDKISFVLNNAGKGQYENFGRVVRRGAELQLTATPLVDVNFSLSYTWLDATNEDTGNTLSASPRHRATAEASWQHDNLAIIGQLVYTSQQYTRSDNSTAVPEVLLANIRGEYSFQQIDLFAEVKNIADRSHVNGTGYQGDPRTWLTGLNYRF
ncbi:MAG: TonB-dependent receptor [Desulfobacterales bacterium]|nr:TonB-dependent receptor [Desulfobacterales bacterium]